MQLNKAYIGIDTSITSTAMCVHVDDREHYFNYTTKEKPTGWMKDFENLISYKYIIYDYPKNYTQSEMYKVRAYNATADAIICDIQSLCSGRDLSVAMEGFSYSSAAGNLIDLVTFGSSLRYKLLSLTDDVTILAPMSLKVAACRLAYNLYDAKKKVWRNDLGVAGGSFQKHEMLRALLLRCPESALCRLLGQRADEMLLMKALPKPVDDVTDAAWAVEYLKERDGLELILNFI